MSKNGKNKGNNKRDKFVETKKKSKAPLIGAIAVLGVALTAGSFLLGSNKSDTDSFATASIGQTVNYSKTQELEQVKLPGAKIEEDKVIVDTITDLKDKKFIYTEYQTDDKRVPLTAIVRPNGSIVVAVSLCEPCRSESFRILEDKIICNACDTIWDLESFEGISGGCTEYPPELLEYTQNGDYLEIDKNILDTWTPRV